MHGKKLLQLAKIVGLSQSAIARHLGIHRAQVQRWFHGTRPIPAKTIGPLIRIISEAVEQAMTAKGEESAWTGMAQALLNQCIIENLRGHGINQIPSLQEYADRIAYYGKMDQAILRKTDKAEELLRLGTNIKVYAELLLAVGPLLSLVAARSQHSEPTA